MNINFMPVLPEIFLVAMILVILMVDVFVSENKKCINYCLAQLTLVGALVLQVIVGSLNSGFVSFNGMFLLDPLATVTTTITYAFAIMALAYGRQYIKDKKYLIGEFYAIFLFTILGLVVMITAAHLLVLYVGLELFSLAIYGLVALSRDNVRSTEAAMKYFILGALASGILLFGISYLYGLSNGDLYLVTLGKNLATNIQGNTLLLVFAIVFVVSGLMFKLGLVPFHMWIPDVYEGSPLAVTNIIGGLTKVAALVFVIRFLFMGLYPFHQEWSQMLLILAWLSLFLGNLVAIAQTNIKRLLGYSTIAHMSFIAFGLAVGTQESVGDSLFYVIVYSLTALATFGLLTFYSKGDFELEKIEDLKGFSKSNPFAAILLLLLMFSMAGIPPLAGFFAKFNILVDLVREGYLISAIFAVVMSLIGAFYYIRIVKVMYFDDEVAKLEIADVSVVAKVILTINVLLVVVLGLVPANLIALTFSVFN